MGLRRGRDKQRLRSSKKSLKSHVGELRFSMAGGGGLIPL